QRLTAGKRMSVWTRRDFQFPKLEPKQPNPGGRKRFRSRAEINDWRRFRVRPTLTRSPPVGTAAVMPRPRQPDPSPPPPAWICPTCQKVMRLRAIEVANGQERIKLACAACGAEAAQTKALSE